MPVLRSTSRSLGRAPQRVLAGVVLGGMWLRPIPVQAAPTQPGELVNPLNPPSTCELCHGYTNAIPDAAEPDYAPLRTWQGTMMANSARDPVFWAGVAVASVDSPGETELCIRCHAPRAFLAGHGQVTSIDELLPNEDEGVECDFCHRTLDDGVTPAGNAQYVVDDVLVDTNVPRRGPWDYTDGVPEPPHTWIFDDYLASSRMCGTCHDVTTGTERVDDAGVGLGVGFNEQRTYSEWLGSAYAEPGAGARSCQDCHMPAVADKPGCTAHLNQSSHPIGGRRHDLVGANRFMVEILRDEYGSAGANLLADYYFDNTIAAMDALLPTAASLAVQAPVEVDLDLGFEGLAVTVTNDTGHKLPTGYSEGRVMWIEVLAEYQGQRVYSSGAWDQATGLERDGQLRTYEAIGERWSDGTTLHLLLNDHWVQDTRIPPLGLLPNLETDPVGDRYVLLGDGTWPNYDQHTYAFGAASEVQDVTPADTSDDELVITVRLRYLINSPEYIDFLASEAGEAGSHVATLFELAGGAPPLTLAEEIVEVPIVGFPPVVGTTGADTTAGSGSSTASAETTAAETTTTSGGPGGTTLPGGTASTESSGNGSSGGPAGDDTGGEGCGCSSPAPAPIAASTLSLLLLGLRRRRG